MSPRAEQCRESRILSSILNWHKVCLWAFCHHSFGHLWDMARLEVDSEHHKDTCYNMIGPRGCNMGFIMSNLLCSKFLFTILIVSLNSTWLQRASEDESNGISFDIVDLCISCRQRMIREAPTFNSL